MTLPVYSKMCSVCRKAQTTVLVHLFSSLDDMIYVFNICTGLAGLSLLENENSGKEMKEGDCLPKLGLRPIYPSLNITASAFQHLLSVQNSWKE